MNYNDIHLLTKTCCFMTDLCDNLNFSPFKRSKSDGSFAIHNVNKNIQDVNSEFCDITHFVGNSVSF